MLVKNPLAVRSRKLLKKATPCASPEVAFCGQAMASSTSVRCAAVHARKSFSNRLTHSRSSQASPPRIAVCRAGWSTIMKSMNCGTPASVALPERSSFGMMRSTSTLTVAYSWAVKNFGLNGVAVVTFLAAACA